MLLTSSAAQVSYNKDDLSESTEATAAARAKAGFVPEVVRRSPGEEIPARVLERGGRWAVTAEAGAVEGGREQR